MGREGSEMNGSWGRENTHRKGIHSLAFRGAEPEIVETPEVKDEAFKMKGLSKGGCVAVKISAS